jgi:hypothetical protein
MGKVTKVSGNTLTLTHLVHTERTQTVKATSSTVIKVKGLETATITNIKVTDVVTASGTVEKDGSITAKRIFVVPGNLSVKPKQSTSSATPSSSQ